MKSVRGIRRGGCHGDLEPAVVQQLHVDYITAGDSCRV